MPTPMHVFNEIAARYEANPGDAESVRDFYKNKLPTLTQEVQQEILDELFARDGEENPPAPEGPAL